MGDAELQPVVAEALGALADALEGLPPERVDTPSLCAGWTIRNVLAHMTMAARYSPEEFTAQLASDGFDFTPIIKGLEGRKKHVETLDELYRTRPVALYTRGHRRLGFRSDR